MQQQKANLSVSPTRMLMLAPHLDNEVHRHAVLQLTFSLEGKAFEVWTEKQGWKETEAVIIHSNIPHALRNFKGWQCTACTMPDVLQGKTLIEYVLKNEPVQFISADQLSRVIPALNNWKENDAKDLKDFNSTLNQVYDTLLQRPVLQKPVDERIQQTLQYITQHITESVSAAELAGRVHLSEDRFLHLFKENTGAALRQYIIWQRVALAFKLFLQGKSLKEAAYESGFSDPAHFTRTFVQINGIQPSVYAALKQHYSFNFFPDA